jgi:hypothetical protein
MQRRSDEDEAEGSNQADEYPRLEIGVAAAAKGTWMGRPVSRQRHHQGCGLDLSEGSQQSADLSAGDCAMSALNRT